MVLRLGRTQAGWSDDARVVSTFTMIRRMRERIHHFAYLAPLTIYPLPPDDIAELLLGPLEYVTSLHAPTLEREFALRGIAASVITSQPEAARCFLRAERGSARVELPALVCEQLLTELTHPACLIEAVRRMLNDVDTRGSLEPALVCLAGEAEAWAGSGH